MAKRTARAARETEETVTNAKDRDLGADTVMVGGMEPEEEETVEVQVELPDKEQERQTEQRHEEAEDAYGDESLGYDEEEAEQRLSRRQRRNRAKRELLKSKDAEIEELRGQLAQMGQVVNGIASGHIGLTARSIDGELNAAQQTLRIADNEFARLLAADPEQRTPQAIQEVMRLRDEASLKVHQLNAAKQRLAEGGQPQRQPQHQPQPRQRQPEPAADPKTEHYASIFEQRHPWYDPEGADEDSDIVRTIGARLEAEGYLPNTPQLWRELENRVRARGLGNGQGAGNEEEDDPPPRRQERRGMPPTGAVRSTGQPGKVTMTLSKMQRDILEEEGLVGPAYDGLRGEEKKAADERRGRYILKWREGMKQLQRAGQ